MIRWTSLMLLGLAVPAPLLAQAAFQDTKMLDRAVAQFTGKPIGAEGGARSMVDARLRLASCATLMLSWRQDNHDAVVVSCPEPAWRIFVPVLTPPPAAAPEQAGAAAAVAPQRKPEIVIRRGDPVSVAVESNGFAISRDGIAMNDAAAGARLLVDVDGPKKPIQAIAVEPGRATLPGYGTVIGPVNGR